MAKTIVIVGTLETKGAEIKYIKDLIERRGHKTIIIDAGVSGEPLFLPDISRDEVAEAAGTDFRQVIASDDKSSPPEIMAEGCSRVAEQLYLEGKLDGILAIGGIMGTTLGLGAMKRLPLWLPKLMVSVIGLTCYSPLLDPATKSRDITIMPTVADFWGVDNVTRPILQNAAGAIAGMVETHEKEEPSRRPLISIITLGSIVCKQALWAKPFLEQKGYDVIIFEPTEMTSEELVDQGLIAGTLDFAAGFAFINQLTHEASENLAPMRFGAGTRIPIPQVFSCGLAEIIGWSESLGPLPPKFKNREVYYRTATDIGIRPSTEEMAAAGEMMARTLNEMRGPTAMLIPTRGFSEWDRPGNMFYNPDGREAFAEALKVHAEPKVKVIELDMHINDPEFAEQAAAILDDMIKGKTKATGAST